MGKRLEVSVLQSMRRREERYGSGKRHRDAPHHEGVPRHHRQRRHHITASQGRDPCPAGGERRGQVHADERIVRPVPAGGRNDQEGWQGSEDRRPQRRHGPGHRHGPSAFQAHRRVHRAGQHHLGCGDHQGGLFAKKAGSGQGGGPVPALRPEGGSGRQGGGHHRGDAAARGDPQDAVPGQPPCSRPRRSTS